jgi:hypothetical protein
MTDRRFDYRLWLLIRRANPLLVNDLRLRHQCKSLQTGRLAECGLESTAFSRLEETFQAEEKHVSKKWKELPHRPDGCMGYVFFHERGSASGFGSDVGYNLSLR